jgi:hypothetical protein
VGTAPVDRRVASPIPVLLTARRPTQAIFDVSGYFVN